MPYANGPRRKGGEEAAAEPPAGASTNPETESQTETGQGERWR